MSLIKEIEELKNDISKLTVALVNIDQIAQEMQKSTSTMVRSWANDIRVYSDEEQRQDL